MEKNVFEESVIVQGLDCYTVSELVRIVGEWVDGFIIENSISAEIIKITLCGSRINGVARDDSDLDVILDYIGDIREDDFFNGLSAEPDRLFIEGIPVDFNPKKLVVPPSNYDCSIELESFFLSNNDN